MKLALNNRGVFSTMSPGLPREIYLNRSPSNLYGLSFWMSCRALCVSIVCYCERLSRWSCHLLLPSQNPSSVQSSFVLPKVTAFSHSWALMTFPSSTLVWEDFDYAPCIPNNNERQWSLTIIKIIIILFTRFNAKTNKYYILSTLNSQPSEVDLT